MNKKSIQKYVSRFYRTELGAASCNSSAITSFVRNENLWLQVCYPVLEQGFEILAAYDKKLRALFKGAALYDLSKQRDPDPSTSGPVFMQ